MYNRCNSNASSRNSSCGCGCGCGCNCGCGNALSNLWNSYFQSICRDCCGNIRVNNGCYGYQNDNACTYANTTANASSCAYANGVATTSATSCNGDYYSRQYGLTASNDVSSGSFGSCARSCGRSRGGSGCGCAYVCGYGCSD